MPRRGGPYLLGLQLVLQHGFTLMQPTEAVDLFLILTADLVLLAASHPLVIFGELDMCQCCSPPFDSLPGGMDVGLSSLPWSVWSYTYHSCVHHLGGCVRNELMNGGEPIDGCCSADLMI